MDEIINKIKDGDSEAFKELFLILYDDLFKIAKSRINNVDDIEDAIQETMIEVYKSVKKLRDSNKAKKWIIKILINKCNRIYKRKYKNDLSMEEYNFDGYISSEDTKNTENAISIYSLLNCLKYEERIIIILYYLENYNIKEIRDILHMNQNTISTHLYRARQKIKKEIRIEEV